MKFLVQRSFSNENMYHDKRELKLPSTSKIHPWVVESHVHNSHSANIIPTVLNQNTQIIRRIAIKPHCLALPLPANMLTSHHQLGRIAPKNSSLTLVEQTTLGYLGKLLKSNADKTQVRQTSHDSKNIRMHRLNQAERAINAFKNNFNDACNIARSLLVSVLVSRFHTKPTSNHVKPCQTMSNVRTDYEGCKRS